MGSLVFLAFFRSKHRFDSVSPQTSKHTIATVPIAGVAIFPSDKRFEGFIRKAGNGAADTCGSVNAVAVEGFEEEESKDIIGLSLKIS
jgi:hypothetical protein